MLTKQRIHVCILPKVLEDNTFFALIAESNPIIDKHLHGFFSFGIVFFVENL